MTTLKADILNFFANFIHDQCGILYKSDNFYQLESRLETIVKQQQLASIEELYKKIQQGGMTGQLSGLLIDSATNNETSFFRDSRVFAALENAVIPALHRSNPQRKLRIWSAASSTGQEIYSVAILVHRLAALHPGLTCELVATDLSERVLNRAREGRFMDLEIRRGLDAEQIATLFDKCEDSGDGCIWAIKPHLKRSITFATLNLIGSWPAWVDRFDVILCRNVLIYQTVEQKQKVVDNLKTHLVPAGYLILGGAESLVGLSDAFTQVHVDGAIFYQLTAGG